MGAKIDAFVDSVSPFSYFAFEYLCKNRDVLASHGVEVEFHPFLTAAVMKATGNRPPVAIPAKGKYGKADYRRGAEHFGIVNRPLPAFFPPDSLLAQRCLVYIKATYPQGVYEAALKALWSSLFEHHRDFSPDAVSEALRVLFDKDTVARIVEAASSNQAKQGLKENTQKAIELGAFGAPYFAVRNRNGDQEYFFGSDRFHYMFNFLGLPTTPFEIVPKSRL